MHVVDFMQPGPVLAQATWLGQQIHRMWIIGDWLYLMYGDYTANTGPLGLLRVSLTSGTLDDAGTLATEETWNLRESGTTALLPYVDPRGSGGYASLTGGAWTLDRPLLDAEHVFDAAITTGSWWLSGAALGANPSVGGAATVWQSTNSGSTWVKSLDLDNPADTGYARVYLLMTFGDQLIAAVTDVAGSSSYHYDGASWTLMGASVGPLTDGIEFNLGGVPYWLCRAEELDRAYASAQPITVVVLDPTVQAQIASAIPATAYLGVATSANHVWLLDWTSQLYRGDTDGTFHLVGVLDANAGIVSIAVDEVANVVYLAGSSGQVWTAALP